MIKIDEETKAKLAENALETIRSAGADSYKIREALLTLDLLNQMEARTDAMEWERLGRARTLQLEPEPRDSAEHRKADAAEQGNRQHAQDVQDAIEHRKAVIAAYDRQTAAWLAVAKAIEAAR